MNSHQKRTKGRKGLRSLTSIVTGVFLSATVAVSFGASVRAQDVAPQGGDFCMPIASSDLVGHWRLDDATGTTAADSSGYNHPGTLSGGTWGEGTPSIDPNGGGLSFDGSDDIVTVADGGAFAFGSGSFTVSLFAKPDKEVWNRSVLGTYSAESRGWGLYFYKNAVNFFGYGDQGRDDYAKTATIHDGKWHHVAGVFTRENDWLRIDTYVDGALAGSSKSLVGDISSDSSLLFGRYLGQPHYQGSLDDVRIYDAALSADNVKKLAKGCKPSSTSSISSSTSSSQCTSGVSTADLQAHWKFDETTGTAATDATGHDNAGTVSGGYGWTSFTAPTHFSNPGALKLDGQTGHAMVSDVTGLATGSSARTVGLWFYTDQIDRQETLISFGDGATADQKFVVMMGTEPTGGPTYLFTDGINGGNNISLTGDQIPSTGKWHHLAFSLDASGGWTYYLDGVMKKSGTFATPINTLTNKVHIGARHDAVHGYFSGVLDDVRVYGRVLSAEEVKKLAMGCGNENGGSSSSTSSSMSSTTSSSTSSSSSVGSDPNAPMCGGMRATIYVKNNKIVGGPQNGQKYNGILRGTAGNDVIVGTKKADIIGGKAGDDVICGNGGNDLIYGDNGMDQIYAGNGRNILLGNAGNDKLSSGNGKNILDGGAGTDDCRTGKGANVILRCENDGDGDEGDDE